MWMFEQLVRDHPWRVRAGAFLVGMGLAMDRRARGSIVLAAFEIGRAVAVEHAKRYALAWAPDESTAYSRA